jgi:hypothetical protein
METFMMGDMPAPLTAARRICCFFKRHNNSAGEGLCDNESYR